MTGRDSVRHLSKLLFYLLEICRIATKAACGHISFCRWVDKAEFPCEFNGIVPSSYAPPPCTPIEHPECPVDTVDFAEVGVNLAGIAVLYATAKFSPWLKEKIWQTMAKMLANRRAKKDDKLAARMRAIAAEGAAVVPYQAANPRNPFV